MRFVHIADMHFDMLSDKIGIGEQRRYDQRVILRKIINYIKENNIKYFFIAGDLYENQYIRTSTIEYINKLFLEIDDTQIFIAPGNHDPLLKNSYYNNFLWNKNVHIFGPKFERIETDNIDIYGYGFDDFYCSNLNFNDLKISNPNKINILVIHGTLDGANLEDMQYNSMSTRMLQEKGFDYVALGHIHKLDYNQEENQNVVYPGSTVSLGFDELGKHGMIVGELEKEKIDLQFVPLDETEFKLYELLQIPMSLVTSVFINIFDRYLNIVPDTLGQKLLVLFFAIVVTGIGAATMVNMKLVPNPADALAATIGDKLGKGMGIGKNVFDVTCFCTSGIIGLVFTRHIIGLGIGTVLAVIFTGRVIAVYNYFLKHSMQNLAGITVEL